MDIANASDPSQKLGAANNTPIADLNPELSNPASRAVRGVVTITWPYSFVKGTFSFVLAEPDFRLRRNKGQVRVNLTGASAKAASESGLSSSDEVIVSLDGAEWEPEQVKKRQSLPGAGVDWQLKFSEKLLLQVMNDVSPAEPEPRAETPPVETSHVDDFPTENLETLTPPSKTHIARMKNGEFESPAFIKRARMSYGSLFEDGYDIFEEDGGVRGRGRKRSRFGRESGAWKYASQSPSPEPALPENYDSSPPRPSMTDEGCQTMEIDFPMPSPIPIHINSHLGTNAEEAQLNPNLTPREEQVAQPRQGMVDHGVQGAFHTEWSTTAPAQLPPFVPSEGLPDDGSELPVFHHTDQFHTGSNDFHQGWDPRSVELPPTTYLHAAEQPLPSDFVDGYDSHRPDRLSVMRPESRTRSPSEPSNLAIDPTEQTLGGLPSDEQNYPLQGLPQTTAYPPLDLENEEQTNSIEGAHLDYPTSYLDESRSFSQEPITVGTTPFGPGVPAAVDAGSSLWTTINDPPQVTAMSSTDRLGSTEGESIDNAVVIDESDSDDDPPPPVVAEDIGIKGHADDLNMYEEADAEDRVDADYSEDEEPEYEADEIGGDYDTRNYTAPDDDEDDSHDEDLRPHRLEPEFDDGRSWEGEGEEDEDEIEEEIEDEDADRHDYDSEYDMDEDDAELQPSPLPMSQSTPQVIDLISSSEDESEDDAVNQPQPLSNLTNNTGLRIQPEFIPSNISAESIAQGGQSESEEDEGDEADIEANIEDESDDEEEDMDDEMQDDISAHSSDELEPEQPFSEEDGMTEFLEERAVAVESSEDEDIEMSSNADPQPNSTVAENPPMNDFSADQRGPPQLSRADSILAGEDDGDDSIKDAKAEKDEVMAPQTAAEGLDILSRVVESESKANSELAGLETMRDDIVITSTTSQAYEYTTDLAQGAVEQGEYETRDTQQDEEPVELLPNGISDSQPVELDENRQAEFAAPLSPSLTHPLAHQLTDEKMSVAAIQETTTSTESQIPPNQFPTPQDTQAMGDVTILEPPVGDLMEVDTISEVNNAAELVKDTIHNIPSSTQQSFDVEEPLAVVEDVSIHVEKSHADSTSASRQQTPLEDAEGNSTPLNNSHASLSFQTQVSADEMAQGSFIESTSQITSELEARTDAHSELEVDAHGADVSFATQMDEELQASILEYSQEFEEVAHIETPNEHEIGNESDSYDDEDNITDNEDETHLDSELRDLVSRGPSPELGNQIEERQGTRQTISMEEVDTPEEVSQVDPSVQLARAANTSKRQPRQHDITKTTYANGKRPPTENSRVAAEDPSVQLARASFNMEEESNSMTAAKLKLVRHLRDELPDCTSLKVIRQHLQKKLSVIAIAMMQPPDPQRAKGGPREFMMSFTITDYSIGPYSVVDVQLYRPHKETLPIIKAGDVVLLRNFTAISIHNKGFGLRTNDESSWAVFDQEGEPPQIKGPPVEYNGREMAYVAHLRAWFNLLDDKAREKLERANKKIIDAGRSK
ncbi:uncharacterized protein GGS22DRAFT_162872 [Annulohypoxylon maeteangense]|uniref:uncharacterized protein n=1 Tax=Annulohypoxylon maeteangense TaxID=1927788 RepID=UPI002008C723|nr:uncharacterized protein GGS22DRAFT_162872 [Annulohypoxylon maeteangense]KAI0885138.1 hypothetical protein GGS22DRAFT_162872 [Annulohypoxylon maeteangense]